MKMGKNERVIKQAIIERNAKKFLLLLVSVSVFLSLWLSLLPRGFPLPVSFSPKSRAALEGKE